MKNPLALDFGEWVWNGSTLSNDQITCIPRLAKVTSMARQQQAQAHIALAEQEIIA
jgi:hypothetical protein